MIASPKKLRPKLTAEHQRRFVTAMLPKVTRVARQTFSDLDREAKEEAVAEVIATAFCMYVGLVERGKESLAYPSVLAAYSVRRVRVGRKAATPQNVRDISSLHCQLSNGITVDRLDRYDRDDGAWREILVEDKTAGPADIAATRIDFVAWLRTLSCQGRRIAETLATGESTGAVARKFRVSPSRISRLRRELEASWEEFAGDAACDVAAVA